MSNFQQNPLIKVCGITNTEDARLSVSLGASFIGLIFVESSPRSISIKEAKRVREALPRTVKLVGVFKDATHAYINDCVSECGLDFVQCHGSENPDFCQKVGTPVIKAISFDPNEGNPAETDSKAFNNERSSQLTCNNSSSEPALQFTNASVREGFRTDAHLRLVEQIKLYDNVAKYVLIDRPKSLAGDDTWLPCAVAALKQARAEFDLQHNYFFAGGLNSNNAGSIISELRPFGLDIASGVEASAGIKSPELLREFFAAVNEAAHRMVTNKGTTNV